MEDRRHNTISESTTFVLGIVDDIFASVFSKIDERETARERVFLPRLNYFQTAHTIELEGEVVPELRLREGSTLQVVAGCGTQKSWKTRQALDLLPMNARIVALSVRISHAYDMLRELKEFGFEVYKDETTDIKNSPRLIISLESLHRMETVLPPSLLILDEVRTLAAAVGGSTVKRSNSYNLIADIYKSSKYCVALDADCELDGAVAAFLGGMDKTRPVSKWILPHNSMPRTMRVGFKNVLTHDICNALKLYHGKCPIVIACGSKKQAKIYANLLTKMGYTTALYHGESSSSTKREHFANPDFHWGKVDAVITTTTISVGIDVRSTSFGKIFLHTCRGGSSLRDIFQLLCRFGRSAEAPLVDTNILVCLDDIDPAVRDAEVKAKTKQHLAPIPTYDTLFAECRRESDAQFSFVLQQLPSHLRRLIPERLDCWVSRVKAWNMLERERTQRRHFDEFKRLADHRGWPITIWPKTDAGIAVSTQLPGITLEQERLLDQANNTQRYEIVKDYVQTNLANHFEGQFFDKCFGYSSPKPTDTALVGALRDVWYVVSAFGEWLDDAEDFTKAKESVVALRNHAMLLCGDGQKLKDRDCVDLLHGSHPEMKKFKSRSFIAGRALLVTLNVTSILKDDIELPCLWVEQVNREANGKVTDEDKGRTCALRSTACELGCRVRTEPKKASLTLLKAIMKKFHMKIQVSKTQPRKRDARGNQIRHRVVSSLSLVSMCRELQDKVLHTCDRCGGKVSVGDWFSHQDTHDVAIEEAFEAEDHFEGCYVEVRERCQRDGRYERLDAEAVKVLLSYGLPVNKLLQPAFKWLQRLRLDEDGLLGPVFYSQRNGYSRRYASGPSLQNCPSILRPLICKNHDIDIANAYPSFLFSMAAEDGLKVPALTKYVKDREQVLSTIKQHYGCGRKAAKELVHDLSFAF